MPHLVNLDALIPRFDFDPKVTLPGPASDVQAYTLAMLEFRSIPRNLLRKPGFQRETNAWTPQKVLDLIQSFLDGDLIPAVILWQSADSNIFVVDGAHRLSALIAWTLDDYGDRSISKAFFDDKISSDQLAAATATRRLVDSKIGKYETIIEAGRFDTGTPEQNQLGRRATGLGIKIQWIVGDVGKAERSFKAINGKATPIDPTEMHMIEDRKKPIAMASRAIIGGGAGHKYWSHVPKETSDAIVGTATEINAMLFEPEIVGEAIVTGDLPVAGRPYSGEGIKLVYDLVSASTRTKRSQGEPLQPNFWTKDSQKSLQNMNEDPYGVDTLDYLRTVKKTLQLITGNSKGSLGLHPGVYCYSSTGARQPAALFAAIAFLLDMKPNNGLIQFTAYRRDFEEYLVRNKDYINQTVKKKGAGPRGVPTLVELFKTIYRGLVAGLDESAISDSLLTHPDFKEWLRAPQPFVDTPSKGSPSRSAKNASFLRDALNNAIPCAICGARIHRNSFSPDHIVRREDGGGNNSSNLATTHWFCNTGYKEHQVSLVKKAATTEEED